MSEDGRITAIREVGEFGLIARMKSALGGTKSDDVIVGIDDDAAVYRIGGGRVHVVTTDTLTEGVHFDRLMMPMPYLGSKCIAVNVSDIAAMNAVPRYATIALGIPDNLSVEDVEALYRGIRMACDAYDLDVIGGDTTAAHGLTLSVTVIGEAEIDRIVFRRGAQPGDLLCLTGEVGASYAGLKVLLEQRRELQEKGEDYSPNIEPFHHVIQRHLVPKPRLDVIRAWAELDVKPNALIDISDGVASEVHHLCNNSGVGAEVFVAAIPVGFETRNVADDFEEDVDTYALFGGEDYELLFTAPSEMTELMDETTFSVIGRITAEPGVTAMLANGESFPLEMGGFQHFEGDTDADRDA